MVACVVVNFVVHMCDVLRYQMVVDALLLCFCEDCQMNDGTEERPYYMNSSLMVNSPLVCFHEPLILKLRYVLSLVAVKSDFSSEQQL